MAVYLLRESGVVHVVLRVGKRTAYRKKNGRSLFLTRDDLRDLSGYKRRADIIRWLRLRGYAFELDKDDWPKVLKIHVEARLQARLGGPKLRAA